MNKYEKEFFKEVLKLEKEYLNKVKKKIFDFMQEYSFETDSFVNKNISSEIAFKYSRRADNLNKLFVKFINDLIKKVNNELKELK